MTLRLLLDPSLRPPRRGSRMTYLEELPRRVHAHALRFPIRLLLRRRSGQQGQPRRSFRGPERPYCAKALNIISARRPRLSPRRLTELSR